MVVKNMRGPIAGESLELKLHQSYSERARLIAEVSKHLVFLNVEGRGTVEAPIRNNGIWLATPTILNH